MFLDFKMYIKLKCMIKAQEARGAKEVKVF